MSETTQVKMIVVKKVRPNGKGRETGTVHVPQFLNLEEIVPMSLVTKNVMIELNVSKLYSL